MYEFIVLHGYTKLCSQFYGNNVIITIQLPYYPLYCHDITELKYKVQPSFNIRHVLIIRSKIDSLDSFEVLIFERCQE